MDLRNVVSILQAAISPVILISGVGLLLLTMTNRLGRVIDRSRQLSEASRRAGSERDRFLSQLEILSKRARLIQLAIGLATVSVLLAAFLVIALFLTAFLHLEIAFLSVILFIACLMSLIGSLVFFLRDINLSLAAVHLELRSAAGAGGGSD